jgi:hypothetical protein
VRAARDAIAAALRTACAGEAVRLGELYSAFELGVLGKTPGGQ